MYLRHELVGFLKAAGEKRAIGLLGAGALVAGGAAVGVAGHRMLQNGPLLKGDAFKRQSRLKYQDRTGSLG